MAYIYDLSDTWNAGGTTFYGIKMNVTNSASAAGSRLLSLQVGSVEQAWVGPTGSAYFAGSLLVGTTAPAAVNWDNEFRNTTATAWPLALNAVDRGLLVRNSSATSGFYGYFEYNGGTNNGSISWSGGTTSFNTTSDERIKEDIADAPAAGALIDAIQVRSWNFKTDGAPWRFGMVAQELLPVFPEAVAVPADPEMMMGVDYSKLVPLLIKEVQSLRARVLQLEGV